MDDINTYIKELECCFQELVENTLVWAKNPKTTIHNVNYSNIDDEVHWIDFEIGICWDGDCRVMELSIPLEFQNSYEFVLGAFYTKLVLEEERRDEIINE